MANKYLNIIDKEATKMDTWSKEVEDSALFTNQVVDAVQCLIDDQTEKNSTHDVKEKRKQALKKKRLQWIRETREKTLKEAEKVKKEAKGVSQGIIKHLTQRNRIENQDKNWLRRIFVGRRESEKAELQMKVDNAREEIEKLRKREDAARK